MILPQTPPSDPSSSTHATYRLKPGAKISDLQSRSDAPLPPLSELDGPFQLSEYLALKVKHDPHDVRSLVDVPKGDTESGGKAPEKDVWIYEHLRRIPIDLTPLITSLLGLCSKSSCPEMKADQWLYFCSAHPDTKECCAIDYILHTVDSTTALLNSSNQFPSRMSIPTKSSYHFPSLFRRLSRIFSHAYFHHREAFSLSESETSLYARFVALCERYELVGENLLVIPRGAIHSFSSHSDQEESEEEEEEEEEEDEEEDTDEDEEEAEEAEAEDARNGARGRGDQGNNREKRTRSLDRHGPLSADEVSSMSKSDRPGAPNRQHTVTPAVSTLEADSTRRLDTSPGKEDPFRSSPPKREMGSSTGAGTLGRGKKPRGTMLWNSDMSSGNTSNVPDVPETPEVPSIPMGPELSRTESTQTAILIEETLGELEPTSAGAEMGEQETNASEAEQEKNSEEEQVPKDEIELLEEEGVIPPQTAVSPLPPPPSDKASEATPEQRDASQNDGEGVAGQSEPAENEGQNDTKTTSASRQPEDIEVIKDNKDDKDAKDSEDGKIDSGASPAETYAEAAAEGTEKNEPAPDAKGERNEQESL